MSDPNPYTPPQVPDPLTTTKAVKRGLGLVVILLLTPVAIVITGGISCAAGAAYFNQFGNESDPLMRGDPLAVALSIFLVPPVFVLVAMLGWAGFRFVDWIKSRRVLIESGEKSSK
jgi:hypothetical protein